LKKKEKKKKPSNNGGYIGHGSATFDPQKLNPNTGCTEHDGMDMALIAYWDICGED